MSSAPIVDKTSHRSLGVRISVPELYTEDKGVLSAGEISYRIEMMINGRLHTGYGTIRGKIGAPDVEPAFETTYFRDIELVPA